jgi:hypothetical protein
MNAKQKLIAFVERIPGDATQDEVLRRLRLYYAVELGLRDIEERNVIDHDELFDELLSDDEKSETSVVRNVPKRSSQAKGSPSKASQKRRTSTWQG